MTTVNAKTKGIPLYKVNGETYCKMIDVMKLIHHEMFETENKEIKKVLDRMEMRVAKNDFLRADAQTPVVIQEKKPHGRYAVGYYDKNGDYYFYMDTIEGQEIYTQKPCKAKLYESFRDASACADFSERDAMVLDFEQNMTEEERWQRDLEMPLPYDWDEGNEDSIPVKIKKSNDIS